jgi:hypothetical protein
MDLPSPIYFPSCISLLAFCCYKKNKMGTERENGRGNKRARVKEDNWFSLAIIV